MKKKLLSFILILCMVCIMFTFTAISASAASVSRDWLWPVPSCNRLSSCYGDGRNHYAIDIVGPVGTPVVASMGGKVVKTYTECEYNYEKSGNCPCRSCNNLGNAVYIEHTYKGKSYVSRYGHFTDVYVSVGDVVKIGDILGTIGSTGRSTGYHLDFQIYEGTLASRTRYVDPLKEPFLAPVSGMNASGASTECCYKYMNEVYRTLGRETDYLDSCTISEYRGMGTANASCLLMSLPARENTFIYTFKLGTVSLNDEFSVLELIINPMNEQWLKIKTASGEIGYILYSNATVFKFDGCYGKVVAEQAIATYKAPTADSAAGAAIEAGTELTVIATVTDVDDGEWFALNNGLYVPCSKLPNVEYIGAMRISGTPYPYNTLTLGKSYSISGSVSSYNEISEISVEIRNNYGRVFISKTVEPKSTVYSFKGSELDYALPFSTLTEGKYTYVMKITETAHGPNGTTEQFVSEIVNRFAIGTEYETTTVIIEGADGEGYSIMPGEIFSLIAKYDVITSSGIIAPVSIIEGNSFSISGTVLSAESALSKVTVNIIGESGENAISIYGSPSGRTYSISRLDSGVKFGSLPAGKYVYQITAVNDCGETVVYSEPFEVLPAVPILPEGSLSNFVEVRDYNNRFTDVTDNDWYKSNVASAYSLGIINGASDTEFAPDTYLTVSQCITLAVNLHRTYYGINETLVPGGEWYQPYVDYAKRYCIIAEDFADYNANATRRDVALIFGNALPAEALPQINTVADGSIPDVPMSSDIADEVYLLYRAGIFVGTDGAGTYGTDTNIRRSEIAAVVSRMAMPELRRPITWQ